MLSLARRPFRARSRTSAVRLLVAEVPFSLYSRSTHGDRVGQAGQAQRGREDRLRLGFPAFRRAWPKAFTFMALRFYDSHTERGSAPAPGQLLEDLVGENQTEIILDAHVENIRDRETLLLQLRQNLSRVPETRHKGYAVIRRTGHPLKR